MRLLAFLLVACPLAVAAQQPLRPPQIAPFGDSQWWVLVEAIPTRIGRSTEIITVPKGFVTDLASIPRFFWAAFPKTGPYMSAAILHDYLYWDQRCTRTQADRIFDIEMRSYGVTGTSRTLIASAVSDFGGSAWQANVDAKSKGTLRFVPEARLTQFLAEPFDASRTWAALHDELASRPSPAAASDPNPALAEVCTRAVQANAEP